MFDGFFHRRHSDRPASRRLGRSWHSPGHSAALDLEPLERRLLLTVPAVLSITRDTPTQHTTGAASVSYSVTFNKPVLGVDAADFRLGINGSLVAASPLTVLGGGSSYTVTVTGLHGSGDLRLDLIDNDSIHDDSSLTLGGIGAANGSFQGQTYTVGQIYPFVQSIN